MGSGTGPVTKKGRLVRIRRLDTLSLSICIRRRNEATMDWDAILMWSKVADSPGRAEAVQKAVQRSKAKAAKKQSPPKKR